MSYRGSSIAGILMSELYCSSVVGILMRELSYPVSSVVWDIDESAILSVVLLRY